MIKRYKGRKRLRAEGEEACMSEVIGLWRRDMGDPVLQHPDRTLPPAARSAVIIISLTPAAGRFLA